MTKGLIIAAPRSGSGKTVVTLGLLAALAGRGTRVAPAKCGPDYIDPTLLARAGRQPAINLDPWAMRPGRLTRLAGDHAATADLLLVEGVMGLFDGAIDGSGSTADLAAMLGLPVLLVVDASGLAQSVAPLVAGFREWRPDVSVAGVVLNRVAGDRHEAMLRAALAASGVPVLGALRRDRGLSVPERHLGLVLPDEIAGYDAFVERASQAAGAGLDLDGIVALAAPLTVASLAAAGLPPLGQKIAVARDDAFAFTYPHLMADWRRQGAEIVPFSPLADAAPAVDADAVFLPGGYPELHAAVLGAAGRFRQGMRDAQRRGALVYGECGGFMVLGEALTDRRGRRPQACAGLLPGETTSIDRPRRVLGYRRLRHHGVPCRWPERS